MILIYVLRVREIVLEARRQGERRTHPTLFGMRIGDVLGLAIAHELGHVLGLEHASQGVMRARPDITDLMALDSAHLFFSARESAIMRRRAELTLREAVR
jgi:hypothetical protein